MDEALGTSVPGVFACGNVLHVHDLVDFGSEEARRAGQSAALVKGETVSAAHSIPLTGKNGVRYTVPQRIRPEVMGEKITVCFRVAEPVYNRYFSCYVDGLRIAHRKKQIMAPGEMEQLDIRRDQLSPDTREIVLCLEEE